MNSIKEKINSIFSLIELNNLIVLISFSLILILLASNLENSYRKHQMLKKCFQFKNLSEYKQCIKLIK